MAFVDIILWFFTEIEMPYEVLRGAKAVRYKLKSETIFFLTRLLSIFYVGLKPLSVIPSLIAKIHWNFRLYIWNACLLMVVPVLIHYLVRLFFFLRRSMNCCSKVNEQMNDCTNTLNITCHGLKKTECCRKIECEKMFSYSKDPIFHSENCWNWNCSPLA